MSKRQTLNQFPGTLPDQPSDNVEMDVTPWRAVNDDVMGGRSAGEMIATDSGLRFQGQLSAEDGGGFASVRRPFTADLRGIHGVLLRVLGDGRRYQFSMRLNDESDRTSWRAAFDTNGSWQTLKFLLDEFVPVFHGKSVESSDHAVSGRIRLLGFLLADKQEAPFGLDVAAIAFVREEEASTGPRAVRSSR